MSRRATARVEGQQRLYIDYTIGKSDFELGKEGKTGSQIKRNKKKERKNKRKKATTTERLKRGKELQG